MPGQNGIDSLAVQDEAEHATLERLAGIRIIIDACLIQLPIDYESMKQVAIDIRAKSISTERPAAAGQCVGLSGSVVACFVDRHTMLFHGYIASNFQRQAIGGIQAESYVAGDFFLTAAMQLINQRVEVEQSVVQCAVEALFLEAKGVLDQIAPLT